MNGCSVLELAIGQGISPIGDKMNRNIMSGRIKEGINHIEMPSPTARGFFTAQMLLSASAGTDFIGLKNHKVKVLAVLNVASDDGFTEEYYFEQRLRAFRSRINGGFSTDRVYPSGSFYDFIDKTIKKCLKRRTELCYIGSLLHAFYDVSLDYASEQFKDSGIALLTTGGVIPQAYCSTYSILESLSATNAYIYKSKDHEDIRLTAEIDGRGFMWGVKD